MQLRLLALAALLVVGCAKPTTPDNFAGREGWPPNVESLRPEAGRAGSEVTLKGAYLTDARKVLIGGKQASFTMAGAEIKATGPADLAPGPVAVVVVVPKGTTAPMTFQVLP